VFTNNIFNDENAFAEAHHNIVDRFLRHKRLPYDDYYDVVVFGFLRAVRQYCNRPELREKYDFNAIAWRKMTDDLCSHYKKQSRPMRRAVTVSLEAMSTRNDWLTMHEVVSGSDSLFEHLEAELICDEILNLLTPEQAEILRMRLDGYNTREIAARRKRRCSDIENMLADIQASVLAMCIV